MGLINKEGWIANWITSAKTNEVKDLDPCPFFRKDFEVNDNVKCVRIYSTCLGVYQLYLNGNKVSGDLFAPGWTSYNKRLLYQTYDVAKQIVSGKNTIGAILGNGWYKGNLLTFNGEDPPISKDNYDNRLEFLMQMHITYKNGKEEVVITDNSWKSAYGPIIMSDIYIGEIYDSRLEMDGWATPNFDESNWKYVKITDAVKNLVSQESLPVRKVKELIPTQIFKSPSGGTLIDMGKNMVGWVKFHVTGKAGDKVILQHGEVLDKEGNLFTANLRTAKQIIEYTLNGKNEEVFEPHFTYQGFRYIRIIDYPNEPNIKDFTGIVISSVLEQTLNFRCSNQMINQLQSNILWSQLGNFLSVPTDCPQRDERLGWTGDAQIFISTACFNMNAAPFFSSWLKDLKLDQLNNGTVPYVVPNTVKDLNIGVAGWGDAATICPWTLYLIFGDKRILEDQYNSMKAWVEYIKSQTDNTFIWEKGFQFGDWLSLDGKTPNDYIATAYFAYSTSILVKVATVLNNTIDASTYSKLYKNIINAFRKEYITPTGRIAVSTQTAHVLALAFNLIEKKHIKRTINTLVNLIKENNNHLTTGFLGTPYLCTVLSEYGYNDVAYMLIQQTTYPSWLYEVSKGATTMWEHWDSIKEDGSICCPDMNSFNHYAFGAVGDWLYSIAGGIRVDEDNPGYKHIIIKPQIGPYIDFVCVEYESIYGKIKCNWKKTKNNNMSINITIPANTTASLYLPFTNIEKLLEKKKSIYETEGVNYYEISDGILKLEVGSGEYEFFY